MSIIIKDIRKNNSEIIRIEVSEFKGRDLINIRIWFQSMDEKGEVIFKPTQKGITLNVSEFNELKDGVLKLENYINDATSGKIPEQNLDKTPAIDAEEPEES